MAAAAAARSSGQASDVPSVGTCSMCVAKPGHPRRPTTRFRRERLTARQTDTGSRLGSGSESGRLLCAAPALGGWCGLSACNTGTAPLGCPRALDELLDVDGAQILLQALALSLDAHRLGGRLPAHVAHRDDDLSHRSPFIA